MLYRDPTNDGDPTDAVLVTSAATWTPIGDRTVVIPIEPTLVGDAGDSFFVGAAFKLCGSHCQQMFKLFGEVQDPTTADRLAKSYLILPPTPTTSRSFSTTT